MKIYYDPLDRSIYSKKYRQTLGQYSNLKINQFLHEAIKFKKQEEALNYINTSVPPIIREKILYGYILHKEIEYLKKHVLKISI